MDISKLIQELKKLLPDTYNKDDNSNLSKLIEIIKLELDNINQKKEELKNQKDIENAEGIYLDRLGANIGQSRGSLNDDQYRILIKSKIQQNLSPGDINNLLDYISAILNIDRETINITSNPYGEPASFQFEIEYTRLAELDVKLQDFYNIISQLKAASVRLITHSRGTFQFAPELQNIFQFSNVPTESEYDLETGFSSVENYTTSGGKFLNSVDISSIDKGLADVEKTKGGFFGSVIN